MTYQAEVDMLHMALIDLLWEAEGNAECAMRGNVEGSQVDRGKVEGIAACVALVEKWIRGEMA